MRPMRALLPVLLVVGCDVLDGGRAALMDCRTTADCVVVSAECCPGCDTPTADRVRAINVGAVDAQHAMVCAGEARCEDRNCMAAPPEFVASCEEERCQAVRLRDHPSTACTDNADCRVRSLACCECGADTARGSLVATSDEEAYRALACGGTDACPSCEPEYPELVRAICRNGSCAVSDSRGLPF